MEHVSFNDSVEALFRRRPNEWIDAAELQQIGGRFAWRTRVSECRVERGLTIENRLRKVRDASGRRSTVSEYRYVAPMPVQLTLEQAS